MMSCDIYIWAFSHDTKSWPKKIIDSQDYALHQNFEFFDQHWNCFTEVMMDGLDLCFEIVVRLGSITIAANVEFLSSVKNWRGSHFAAQSIVE